MKIQRELETYLSTISDEPAAFGLTDTLSHGDLMTSWPLKTAKATGRQPTNIAAELAQRINQATIFAGRAQAAVAGPGFVNVTLSDDELMRELDDLEQLEPTQPVSDLLVGQTILVEYSQPNIAKPMHLGHLRTTILGETIKRLLTAAGARAVGINHLGDWGSQFGKLLAAYKRWGTPETLAQGGIKEMLRLYVVFHDELERDPEVAVLGAKEFAKLEAGDAENRQLWQEMRDVSMLQFRAFYERLGITMDEPELGESDFVPELPRLIADALARGVASESEGAIVIPVGEDLPPCLIRKSDGATLYATRDLAAVSYRVNRWHPTRILYVVAADQSLHFEQVFRAAAQLGIVGETVLEHIPYGLVSLPEGKMSTRKGRVIFLDDVLAEAVSRTAALIAEKSPELDPQERAQLAEQIGVSAVKYQILNQNRQTTIVFDWDKIISLQGNTAPYLVYTRARALSVLRKAGVATTKLTLVDLGELDSDERTVLRHIIRLENVVERAATGYAPNTLADWLYQLAALYNHFYESYPILQADAKKRAARLALSAVVAVRLKHGLELLGLATPDRL